MTGRSTCRPKCLLMFCPTIFQWPYWSVCVPGRGLVYLAPWAECFLLKKRTCHGRTRLSPWGSFCDFPSGSRNPKCTWAKYVARHIPECCLWLRIFYQKFHCSVILFFRGGCYCCHVSKIIIIIIKNHTSCPEVLIHHAAYYKMRRSCELVF